MTTRDPGQDRPRPDDRWRPATYCTALASGGAGAVPAAIRWAATHPPRRDDGRADER
ncbi:hypothetical protein [Nocardia cyriacigeorgica]|uniref:hypothetical protein n=1 Tax=Nocardia cyriacigeorgica TaxID=135487 RepID=UPI003EDF1249